MSVKLTELNPKWWAEPNRHGQGITFDCPHCRQTRLAVAFTNPLDNLPIYPLPGKVVVLMEIIGWEAVPPGAHWQRTGMTFEGLTLTPSVDASKSGHWHGFITNGEISTV